MKKLLIVLLAVGVAGTALADLQAPPDSRYTSTRKLSRGLSNVLYCWTELPNSFVRKYENREQSVGIVFDGLINGLERTGQRFSYGVYEVVNFRRPIWKDSYRPPYTSINYDTEGGYEEFPPQIGFISTTGYVRERSF